VKETSTRLWTDARTRLAKSMVFLLFIAVSQAWAAPPDLEFRPPATAEDPATPMIMRDLAARLIPVYEESDTDRYLANLSALQMTAGDYAAAYASRQTLLERRREAERGRPMGRAAIFDLYAHAKNMESDNRMSFPDAFTKAFQEDVVRLDDQDAYAVTQWLETSPIVFREALQQAFDRQQAKDSISETEAVALIWTYISFDAYRAFGPLVGPLDAEEDRRRYTVEEVVVPTADRASISALVFRPKSAGGPLPALLELTIYHAQHYAKECAAHGYVGVVAYTRGTGDKSLRVIPYEHDGADARTVIDWIAKQSWSDGRVGMYGEGYSGFTPWAAAKGVPSALKAIATSAADAPGIDVPMVGNIFKNSAYRWSLHVTTPTVLDDTTFRDDAFWQAFDAKWYRSGSRYRDLGRLFGHPNPIFIRWLNHPSYDRYWQKMVPYREEFAHINIPVLTTTGYYAASEPADLYFFTEHHRYDPHADHTLLIGPYDDRLTQRGLLPTLNGYPIDSAAQVDFHELRYQWFDHVFKGSASPTLLTDKVNYEVMGANEWQHAPSLDAMADRSVKYFLNAAVSGLSHRLTKHPKTKVAFTQQTVSLVDRTDSDWVPPADILSRSLAPRYGTMFVSQPLTRSSEFNGLFSGRLDLSVNKMDVDLYISLYERLPSGDFVRLFGPSYEFRASYLRDRVHRQLLKAGERQTLTFKSERLMSRRLQKGSRLVIVLGIDKRPDREINYGTGNDVSDESLADGNTTPLKIRWYSDSYVEIPVRQ